MCNLYFPNRSRICVFIFVAVAAWTNAGTGEAAMQDCIHAAPSKLLHKIIFEETYFMLEELGKVSDNPSFLSRTFLSPAHKRAGRLIQHWMALAGLETWIDNVANVHGVVRCEEMGAREIVIGSHYDTVVDGGKYDGALGILSGISAVKALILQEAFCNGNISGFTLSNLYKGTIVDVRPFLTSMILLPRPIHVIGFSDEEGVRFQSTFIGSRAVVGTLNEQFNMVDSTGQSLKEVLMFEGFDTSMDALDKMLLNKDQVYAYVEVHIEQGPILEHIQQPIGVVSGIAGQTRLYISIEGHQGHAGTVPMNLRRNPLHLAAHLISQLDDYCSYSLKINQENHLVCTVGAMHIHPNAGNVIPRYSNFTVDVRSKSDDNRLQVLEAFTKHAINHCNSSGMICSIELKHEAHAVLSPASVQQDLQVAVNRAVQDFLLLSTSKDEACVSNEFPECFKGKCMISELSDESSSQAPLMMSGAGHDAMVLGNIAPMGMIFVRCRDGLSHSPEEFVAESDVAMGTLSLLNYMQLYFESHSD